ncbi:MAG TPA: energy transducer TonB [Candidatus Solibacter sp.]|nr:energy transducer TonB [Candidatus Solibacter sp.]
MSSNLATPLAHFRDAVRAWSDSPDARFTVFEPTDHLARLLPAMLHVPWYRSLWSAVRDVFQPAPPLLDVTSKPVLVRDIWGQYGRQKKSWVMSVSLQSAVIAAIFAAAVTPVVRHVQPHVTLTAPVDPPELAPKHTTIEARAGGSGGDRSPMPASHGRLLKFSHTPFVPPVCVVPNPSAKFTMDPALLGPPELKLPNVDVAQIGDPWSKFGGASNGPGRNGGIGNSCCGGVGLGDGSGAGPGRGIDGGVGDVYSVGIGGVTAPVLLTKVEPEYSEEARKAKFQGVVQLYAEIDPSGHARNIRTVHSLGLGLDEKAMEAVAKWKFRPGTKEGKAVTVMALIEVSFRLL